MKALVVDDSSAMRSYLRRILAEHGFETAQAGDGEEALAVLDDAPRPDLILLDWNMPGRNGFETLKEIRERDELSSVPVMMVTTEVDMSEVVMALDAGANEYLMKPFTPEIMSAKLELLGFGAITQ